MCKIFLCPDCKEQDIVTVIGCGTLVPSNECFRCSKKNAFNCSQTKEDCIFVVDQTHRCDPCNEVRNVW